MAPCPQVVHTVDTTTPVPGHPTYNISNNFGSELNVAKDTLYVAAVDSVSGAAFLGLVDFPAMTIVGFHPGPISLDTPFPFCVGPDDSVYVLYRDPAATPANSVVLQKWSPAGSLLYSVATTGVANPDTAIVYNPVDDLLYGWAITVGASNMLQQWDPATGAMTSYAWPHTTNSASSRPVVTADGTVWTISQFDDEVWRFDPATASWSVYPTGFQFIGGLWNGPDANSVAVIDNTVFNWHKVDSSGTVTTICTAPTSTFADILASTVVSDDFSIVLLEGTGDPFTGDPVHYYRWTAAARVHIGRIVKSA